MPEIYNYLVYIFSCDRALNKSLGWLIGQLVVFGLVGWLVSHLVGQLVGWSVS